MADEPFALTIPAPPEAETDYDAICAAVMETGRGRWFLTEFARRNRNADTEVLLAALERIEAMVRGESAAESAPPSVSEATGSDDGEAGIDALPQNLSDRLESATASLRSATERLQDVAWRLREHQYDDRFCDEIDAETRDIVAACAAIERVAAASRQAAMETAPESADATAAAPPAETAPEEANDAFEPLAAQPIEEFTIAWGVGFSLDSGAGAHESDPHPLPERWDHSALVRAFETEAAPSVSDWQLPEEEPDDKATETDAERAAPAAEVDAMAAEPDRIEPAVATAPAEVPLPESEPVKPEVPEPAAVIQAAAAQAVPPQPKPPRGRVQEKIQHERSEGKIPQPSGGWLSSLLNRMARGEAEEEGGEPKPAIAAAPKDAPAPAARPLATEPPVSTPHTRPASPSAAMTISDAAPPPPPMPVAQTTSAVAPASTPFVAESVPQVTPVASDIGSAPPQIETPEPVRIEAPVAPIPAAAATEAAPPVMQAPLAPPPTARAPMTALQEAVVQAIAAAVVPAAKQAPPRDFAPLFDEPAEAAAPPPSAEAPPAMPAAASIPASPVPEPARIIAEARAVDTDDDAASFLLEPLPAALAADLAKAPVAVKPQILSSRAPEPRPAPRDPLAPIRAMSEEEKIALSS